MKKCISIFCLVAILLSIALPASAANHYIVPDSNTRRFTREELWTWQYDALGYIFNEIFARHGYHFNPGGQYDNYFRSQTWYHENPMYDNQGIYKNLMTNIEWYNERLAKEVREEMRALGTTNPNGKALSDIKYEPEIYGAFSQFQPVYFAPNQKLPVYSGPGTHYHRSANGKALASTNGHIYVGGWENGWLQIMYWTNDYNVRVGYTQSSNFKDKIDVPHLRFEYAPATITRRTALTDDPVASFQPMATLESGTQVTYLADAYNEKHWAYVEMTVGGTMMRGYIDADAVSLLSMQADEPSLAPAEVVAEVEKEATTTSADTSFPEIKVGGVNAKTKNGYVKHKLWGIGPENWDSVPTVLQEKGIAYTKGDNGRIQSKEGQSITMFGIPVSVLFDEPYRAFIFVNDEWRPKGEGRISDADLQKTMDGYDALLAALEKQYGAPTGGYMYTSTEWSYPLVDGALDWETVQDAMAQVESLGLNTYYHNVEASVYISNRDEKHFVFMRIEYRYDSDEHGEQYDAISLDELLSFTRPAGPFTTKPQSIEIGF